MNTFILNGMDRDVDNVLPYRWRKLVCQFAFPEPVTIPFILPWQRRTIATPAKFVEQVGTHDVIEFCGGDTPTLIHTLNSITGWQEVMQDKVILAWSAGISALMKYSFNVDHRMIVEGLGILPFQSIVHYNTPEMSWMVDRLHIEHPEIPILTIPDDTTITIRL